MIQKSSDYLRPGQNSPVKIEEDVLLAETNWKLNLPLKEIKVDEGKTSAWLKSMGVEMGTDLTGDVRNSFNST